MSAYRFLSDHWIAGQYYPAGTMASTADVGGTLPVGWLPSGAVDPLDAPAVAAFYAAGPQGPLNPVRTQFVGLNVVPPATFWKFASGANPNRTYQLTGLGAALPPALGFS